MWAETFGDSSEWRRWFFDNVYNDDEALILVRDGSAVSSMLLQKYIFRFCGREMACGYIAGANTRRNLRGKGYMCQLMKDALSESYARGEIFVSLIPASDSLYFFYDRFGFATVVYVDVERYTSLHDFGPGDNYIEVEPTYDILHYLENEKTTAIIHTPEQWKHVIADVALDKGRISAVTDKEGIPAALAVAVERNGEVKVKFLAVKGDEQSAGDAVLGHLRKKFGNKPIEVWASTSNEPRSPRLRSRSMMRIVDAHSVLSAIAAANIRMRQVIALHDPQIPANNGYYIIKDGECRQLERTMRPVTLDIDVTTLTSIIFSSPQIGSVFGFDSTRPSLDLMLD